MRAIPILPLCGLCFVLLTPAFADSVHVSITKPLTPMTDVLSSLSQHTGTPIIADDTVAAPLGIADLHADSLEGMLTDLKGLDPGLTWQKLYLPASQPLPTGDALEQQVAALKSVSASGLTLDNGGDTVTFTRIKSPIAAAPPAGMQLVYLVTDENVRAQRLAAAQSSTTNTGNQTGGAAGSPVSQTNNGLANVAAAFGQMTADQQMQALPGMFQQFRAIMQEMNPTVRAQIQQQFGARLGQGGGQGNGNGQ